jgi:hypothetical protein
MMKTISFSFWTSRRILYMKMIFEDCSSLDAAAVPWVLACSARGSPHILWEAFWDKEYRYAVCYRRP